MFFFSVSSITHNSEDPECETKGPAGQRLVNISSGAGDAPLSSAQEPQEQERA